MRIKTWQAVLVGLAAGVVCTLAWHLVFCISCPPFLNLLPWPSWPVVALVTAAVTAGLILFRRRAARTRPAFRPLSRPGIRA